MFTVKTLNEIAPIYKDYLPEDQYNVSADAVDADAILVRSADMHKLELPQTLLAVARAGAGVNNIPIDALSQKGVVVFNTPGANANAVRELAVAALLLSSRKIIKGIEWVQTLKGMGAEVPKLVEKGKSKFVGPELRGKTLGVIGLGGVGVLVANAGAGLDMNVIGFDPFITVEHAWMLSRSVHRVSSQDELLAKSDYVSIHIPLMDETRGTFGATTLGKMKKGATLINLSRGELVVNKDVLAAIANRQIRAYVTDFPEDELIGEKGVIAIPHLGASTPESEDNCVVMASCQIDDYLRRGAIRNSVNYPDYELGDIAGHRVCVLHANVQGVVGAISLSVLTVNIRPSPLRSAS